MQRIAPAARSAMTVTIGNSIESMSFTTFTPVGGKSCQSLVG
ncbi:hypothetical protein PC116_g11778 [Phytophthora cactorum]|nr:hypothetical protein PC116_g11778 [Phytophthora cactorum]